MSAIPPTVQPSREPGSLRALGSSRRIPRLSRAAFRESGPPAADRQKDSPEIPVANWDHSGSINPEVLPDVRTVEALPNCTETEKQVARIWASVLRRADVGITDNFFMLGGHSLSAMKVLARIDSLLGVELPVRSMFELPTVAALAARIDAARPDKESAAST